MKSISTDARARARTIAALATAAVCLLGAGVAIACDAGKSTGASSEGGDSTAHGGIRAYIDPETGQLTVPPPSAEAASATARAVDNGGGGAATEIVTEAPSAVPGGGYVIDLRGRGKFSLTGALSPSGQSVAHCDASKPARNDEDD